MTKVDLVNSSQNRQDQDVSRLYPERDWTMQSDSTSRQDRPDRNELRNLYETERKDLNSFNSVR